MPYTIVERDGEYCVYKKGVDGPEGESLGCHETREDAQAQIAAIEANETSAKVAVVKALASPDGDRWELEVLGVPYGGPFGGKDAQGEYFSPATRLHEDKYPLPPVVYYHGLTPDGTPAGAPEYIGRTIGFEDRPDGRWYRVVLDRASALARRVWDAARRGIARASSGSVAHLVRRAPDGHIMEWPVAELSVFDVGDGRRPANAYAIAVPVLKAIYSRAGVELPAEYEGGASGGAAGGARGREAAGGAPESELKQKPNGGTMTENMKPEEIAALAAQAAREALEAAQAAERQRLEEEAARKAEIEKAIEEARKAWETEAAKAGRLPFDGSPPAITRFARERRYDHIDAGTHALAMAVLEGAAAKGQGRRPSEDGYRSLALKLLADEGEVGAVARPALKAAGIMDAAKADEVNYSTLAGYGDEWVTIAYSQRLWESIRHETAIVSMLPTIEVPQGAESITIPLESTDPTFYKIGQVTSDASSGGLSTPSPTVPSSLLATAQKSVTVGKLGARVRWSGELTEDSIIPWVEQLRAQLVRAGAEQLEHVIIDGDTATGASTNINDIAGTPAGTEAFLLADGFRKLPLVTNTANSVSIGALSVESFKSVLRLLGAAGKHAADPTRVAFIVDPNVYWKLLELSEIKTRDVSAAPTLENGRVTALWGYPVLRSYSMHWVTRGATGYEYKANSAGKNDQDTAANNTTGSILAVRWDQWLLPWKRRMTIETTRHPEWDGSEIVVLMRLGLVYRDTEASAIGYNVTV